MSAFGTIDMCSLKGLHIISIIWNIFYECVCDQCSVYKVHCECGKSLKVVFYEFLKRFMQSYDIHSSWKCSTRQSLGCEHRWNGHKLTNHWMHWMENLCDDVKSFVKMYLKWCLFSSFSLRLKLFWLSIHFALKIGA